MQKNEVLDLIATLPLEEDVKLGFIDDLGKMPHQKVLEKISVALGMKEKLLEKTYPEAAKEYSEINAEYEDDVKKASDQFDIEFAEIEKEAEEIDRDISKDLDMVRVDELKASLA